ncbi:MAG: DUF5009 domain-containing protein [Chitinophagaceae bacterium]|nr:DUF5009 domain-containing protein [Chitinophagaceae bacterium]
MKNIIETNKPRLESLDALRGFDMFWIIGGDAIIKSIALVTGTGFWAAAAAQMDHPDWNGFHFFDLIFPLFLFIAGVATPYSIGKELEKGKTKSELLRRIIKRSLILIFIGFITANRPDGHFMLKPLSEYRYASVLGRIGLAYMLANIIYLYTKEKAQMIWFWALIIGYWLLLKFTSAPGHPIGDLSMEGNFASYLDRSVMPGQLYLKIHDPEGLVSTIPSISTGLLGIITGMYLKKPQLSGNIKSLGMLICGVTFLLLAQLWNIDFPINKNLWSSSFVLYAGGFSLILLSVFYYIIDVLGFKQWAFFFKVIGINSILIYISGIFINWEYTTKAFFNWLLQLSHEPHTALVYAVCMMAVKFLLLYVLYRKKVFLRV